METIFHVLAVLTFLIVVCIVAFLFRQDKRITQIEFEAKQDREIMTKHLEWGEARTADIMAGIEEIKGRLQ